MLIAFSINFKGCLCLFFLASIMFNKCFAVTCNPGSGPSWVNYIYTFKIDRTSDITQQLPIVALACSGSKGFNDAFRISDVILNPKLIEAGFTATTLNVGSETFTYPFTEAFSQCIWPDATCISTLDRGAALPYSLTLKRVGPGPDVSFTNGDILATIKVQYRRHTRWGDYQQSTQYILQGAITPRIYTCNTTEYNASIRMPSLDAVDIKRREKGILVSTKRPFNFRVTCINGTVVFLQFDGETLTGTGTDSVLKNQLPRNDNLGIQLFDGARPLVMGEKFLVTDSAVDFIDLAYDAYYYYKGGEVNGGPFKAQVTFTFTYE